MAKVCTPGHNSLLAVLMDTIAQMMFVGTRVVAPRAVHAIECLP